MSETSSGAISAQENLLKVNVCLILPSLFHEQLTNVINNRAESIGKSATR